MFGADEWDSTEFTWREQPLKPGFRRPVIVHRAILGSVERFMAILIEHLGGKWPFWISPRQIIVCPISEKAQDYCESVQLYFHRLGYHAAVDESQGSIAKKVRNAQLAQWNYILVAGEDEMRAGLVDVRTRDNKRHGKMRVDDLAEHLKTLKPEQSSCFQNKYATAWNPDDFPRDAGPSNDKGAGTSKDKDSRPSTDKFDELDAKLREQGGQWFSGQAGPSSLDREIIDTVMELGVAIDPKVHPHLFGWYSIASKFNEKIRASWK